MAQDRGEGFFSRLFRPVVNFFIAIGSFFRSLFSSSGASSMASSKVRVERDSDNRTVVPDPRTLSVNPSVTASASPRAPSVSPSVEQSSRTYSVVRAATPVAVVEHPSIASSISRFVGAVANYVGGFIIPPRSSGTSTPTAEQRSVRGSRTPTPLIDSGSEPSQFVTASGTPPSSSSSLLGPDSSIVRNPVPRRPAVCRLSSGEYVGESSLLPATEAPITTAPRTIQEIFAADFRLERTTDNGDCLFAAVAARIPGQTANTLRDAVCTELDTSYAYMDSVQPLIEHVREAIKSNGSTVAPGCRFDRSRTTPNVYGDNPGQGALMIADDEGSQVLYMGAYIAKMREAGVYATGLEIIALARAINRPIVVLSGDRADVFNTAANGDELIGGPPIFIHYNGTNHYSALTYQENRARELYTKICEASEIEINPTLVAPRAAPAR